MWQTRKSIEMENVRCGKCRALLFKARSGAIAGSIEIKCRRCGTINHLRPSEPATDRPERPTATEAHNAETGKATTPLAKRPPA